MGKNLAIIIGVSNYETLGKLPPCENDIKIIQEIISFSKKYSSVLTVDNSPKGYDGIQKITKFVRENEGQDIDELFFYYSGHGARRSDDFLYLFSDFNPSQTSQTSLKNSELDTMIKSLNPKLTVKILDACQSGTEYIKSEEDLKMIFEKSSGNNFKKTYFMFSSATNQNSIAEMDYSVFTKSFAKAVSINNGEVLYRNIMSYIADDENVKKHQDPLFIVQANNTEIFCLVDKEMSEKIKKLLGNDNTDTQEKHDPQEISTSLTEEEMIIRAIKKKSEEYCSEKEAMRSIQQLADSVNNYKWKKPIPDLYKINIETHKDYGKISYMKTISEWVIKNDEYFAKATHSSEAFTSLEPVRSNMLSLAFGGSYDYKEITKYRDVPDSIRLTADSPFKSITLTFEPLESSLPWFKFSLVYVFSKLKMTVFYKCELQKEINWQSQETIENKKWNILHCKIKDVDEIKNNIEKALQECGDYIFSEIKRGVESNS